jgi:hypothetical protein
MEGRASSQCKGVVVQKDDEVQESANPDTHPSPSLTEK